ncbi:hypothetical protein KFE98_03965 [bacterium SCSIO 12741]|nr:hypothetical protein KFE98_03965 [bacterium SCSIO 12741]
MNGFFPSAFLSFVALFLQFTVFAQSDTLNPKKVDANYDRLSLTYLYQPSGDRFESRMQKLFEKVRVTDKFNDNRLEDNVLEKSRSLGPGASGGGTNAQTAGVRENSLGNVMRHEQVGKHILEIWYNQQEDGSMNMDRVTQRGQYNASDEQVKEAMMTRRGLSFLDEMALTLIDKSYVLVMRYNGIRTMKEIYDQQDAQRRKRAQATNQRFVPVERSKNGYKGNAHVYLYKIDFNDELSSEFYSQLWVNSTDPDSVKQARKAALDTFDIPFTFVFRSSFSVEGTQFNPGYGFMNKKQGSKDDMLVKLMQDGVNRAIDRFERKIPSFRVKTRITDTHPIRAKVGRKEGLGVEQRYFVWEDRQGKDGTVASKRKGVIRVRSVVDNRKISEGDTEPSQFFQVAGRKIRPGMLIEQKKALGIGIRAGYGFGEIRGFMLGFDFNLSNYIGSQLPNMDPGWKLWIEGAADFNTYNSPHLDYYDRFHKFLATHPDFSDYESDEIWSAPFNFYRLQGGFSRDFAVGRNFTITPGIGWCYEWGFSTILRDSDGNRVNTGAGIYNYQVFSTFPQYSLDANVLEVRGNLFLVNLQVARYLYYPLQVYGRADYYIPFFNAVDREDKFYLDRKYTDFFPGREGLTLEAGIRIDL